jgi:hypothetical protein
MDRGSNKHSPRVDDEMAQEVRGIVQGTAGARVEEFREAEPSGEDQPEVSVVPNDDAGLGEPAGVGSAAGEELSRFGSYIGRAFPGDRAAIEKSARDLQAPDDVLDLISQLPPGTEYRNTAEVWHALGR